MARVRYTEIWERVNVRPEDYISHRDGGCDNSGDCSTRCLVYCLGGDYRATEDRQYAIADDWNRRIGSGTTYHRNSTDIFSVIFHENGYYWIHLEHTISRGKLAVILAEFEKIATLSRTHICPINKGKVIDIWDSTAGQVFGICVKKDDIPMVRETLLRNGIGTEEVEKIRHTIKHHRRHRKYNFWC